MPISNYGVLKGRAFDGRRATAQSEHYQVMINRGFNPHRIAINTKSAQAPSQVLYYADDNFQHEITDALRQSGLEDGFTPLQSVRGGLALDFIRRNLFSTDDMVPLPSRSPGDNDDLNDKLNFFVQQAIQDSSATVYAFGQHWEDQQGADKYFNEINPSTGIHDIHLNQGNPEGKFFNDNGPWQDGGLLFHFAGRNRWSAIFTAFQSQSFHTDDETGNPLHADGGSAPGIKGRVRIIAAMVNPHGGAPEKEYLILLNKGDQPVNLDGWRIIDKDEKADAISGKKIDAGDTLRISLSGNGAQLGNKGGNITLIDGQGLKIDGVSYTKKDASAEGELIEL